MQQQSFELPLQVNLEIPEIENLNSPETQEQAHTLEKYLNEKNVLELQTVVLYCIFQKTTPVYDKYSNFNGNKYSSTCRIPIKGYNKNVYQEVVRRFTEKGYSISRGGTSGSQMNYEGDTLTLEIEGVEFKNTTMDIKNL